MKLAVPFFRKSMPHRGRILRVVGKSRGPVLRDYHGTNQLFPTQYIPHLRDAAIAKLGDLIEREVSAA